MKALIVMAALLAVVGFAGCGKRTDAPEGMTVQTDSGGAKRLQGPAVPADAPQEAKAVAANAPLEAQRAAQQNAAMAEGLRKLKGQ